MSLNKSKSSCIGHPLHLHLVEKYVGACAKVSLHIRPTCLQAIALHSKCLFDTHSAADAQLLKTHQQLNLYTVNPQTL